MTVPSHATDIEEEMLFTRAVIAAGRAEIVLVTLGLTEEEGKLFSPVYLDYRVDMDKEAARLADLILDYSDNFGNLSDEKALEMLDEYLNIEKKRIAVKKKYVKRFKKVLTPKKLVQFYQIGNKMDAIIMLELAAEVPLVR
jgi:hypothetical protein